MERFLKRFSQLQSELKVPKDQTNQFGGYKFRSCEDILEAAKPLLSKNGLVLTLTDSVVQIGERYYIRAEASLRDTESEAVLTNTAFAREPGAKKGSDESQITGAASSYARKYALNGLFCIDDTKDADTDEFRAQQRNTPEPPKTPEHLCDRCGKAIRSYRNSDGSVKSVEDQVGYSLDTFQMTLCSACILKLLKSRNGQS